MSEENPSACVPTSRISERYVVDLLLHELNPFRFRYRTSREIPLDVYSAPISLVFARVVRNLRVPSPRIHTLCILIGARDLFCPVASSIEEFKVLLAQWFWTTCTVYLWKNKSIAIFLLLIKLVSNFIFSIFNLEYFVL